MRRKPVHLKEPNLILFYNKIVSKNKKIVFLRKIKKWVGVTIIVIVAILTFLKSILPEEILFIPIIFFSVIFIILILKINFIKKRISFSKGDFENIIYEVNFDIGKEKFDRKPIDIKFIEENILKQKQKIKNLKKEMEDLEKEHRMRLLTDDQEKKGFNALEDDLNLAEKDLGRMESNFELALETLQLYEKKDAYYKASLDAAEEFLKNQFGVAPLQKLKDIPKQKRRIMAVKNY